MTFCNIKFQQFNIEKSLLNKNQADYLKAIGTASLFEILISNIRQTKKIAWENKLDGSFSGTIQVMQQKQQYKCRN